MTTFAQSIENTWNATCNTFRDSIISDNEVQERKMIIKSLEISKIGLLIIGATAALSSLALASSAILALALAFSFVYLSCEAFNVTHNIQQTYRNSFNDFPTVLSEINQNTFQNAPLFGCIYRSVRTITE